MKIKAQVLSVQEIKYTDKQGHPARMYKHEVFLPEYPAVLPVMAPVAHKAGDVVCDVVLTRDRQSLTIQLPAI